MLQKTDTTLVTLYERYVAAYEAWGTLGEVCCDLPDETGDAVGKAVNGIADQMAATPVRNASDALAVLKWCYFTFGDGTGNGFSWDSTEDCCKAGVSARAMLASLREWLTTQEGGAS